MDRLKVRKLVGCGVVLALLLPGAGCRSTRSEVPPSPSFSGNGQAPIGFNKDANPVSGAAGLPTAGGQYGIPNPSSTPSYGPPGNGGFGAPGTNSGPQAGTSAASTPGLASPGGAANPSSGIPQTGTGSSGPAAGIGAAPTASPF